MIDFLVTTSTQKLTQQRGAAEARRAHNPEDPGSKPGVATVYFSTFLAHESVHNFTWHGFLTCAEWQRIFAYPVLFSDR